MYKAEQAIRLAAYSGAVAYLATHLVSHRDNRSVLRFHSKMSGLSDLNSGWNQRGSFKRLAAGL